MREVEGAGVLHKSDNDYNIKVTYFIKLAKQTANERESLNILGKGKTEEEASRADEKVEYVIEETMKDAELEDSNLEQKEEIEEER